VSGFFILNLLHLNFLCIFVLNLKYIVMENQQEKEFTVEELAAQKENMLKFYTESLPYLDAQYQYEELLLKIDEARFKRNNIQMQYAMMAQAQQESEAQADQEDDEDELPLPELEQKARKLKRG
jgi:hypothetical protein